jgi:hypothetical protein
MFLRIVCLLLVAPLSGCITNQLRLSDLDEEVKTISIHAEVKMAEEIYFKNFGNEKADLNQSSISALLADPACFRHAWSKSIDIAVSAIVIKIN